MQNSFFQKLVLVVIAGALTAGVVEFYKVFVVGGMESSKSRQQLQAEAEPSPTPRRY